MGLQIRQKLSSLGPIFACQTPQVRQAPSLLPICASRYQIRTAPKSPVCASRPAAEQTPPASVYFVSKETGPASLEIAVDATVQVDTTPHELVARLVKLQRLKALLGLASQLEFTLP